MKSKFKYDKPEEDEYYSEEDERPEGEGFDLRGKSLKNTAPKHSSEPKKEVLPLKAIMKGILERNETSEAAKTEKVNSI